MASSAAVKYIERDGKSITDEAKVKHFFFYRDDEIIACLIMRGSKMIAY